LAGRDGRTPIGSVGGMSLGQSAPNPRVFRGSDARGFSDYGCQLSASYPWPGRFACR
jgi:hypothetical protein